MTASYGYADWCLNLDTPLPHPAFRRCCPFPAWRGHHLGWCLRRPSLLAVWTLAPRALSCFPPRVLCPWGLPSTRPLFPSWVIPPEEGPLWLALSRLGPRRCVTCLWLCALNGR